MPNKVAFISDVHGNYPALRSILRDIDNRGIERVICLGDLVGYYSMINEVIEEIRNRKIECILGNHDYALLNTNGIIERSKTCTAILKKQITYISAENRFFLSTLPDHYIFSQNNKSFFCVHGGLDDYIDEYLLKPEEGYFESRNFKYDFLVTGHTHQLINSAYGNITHLNPGSVGQPRDNDPRSSYLITDGLTNEFVRVEYDVQEIISDMQSNGFEEYIYAGLLTGKKIG